MVVVSTLCSALCLILSVALTFTLLLLISFFNFLASPSSAEEKRRFSAWESVRGDFLLFLLSFFLLRLDVCFWTQDNSIYAEASTRADEVLKWRKALTRSRVATWNRVRFAAGSSILVLDKICATAEKLHG